jgi:TorA maturation chaperone TorD
VELIRALATLAEPPHPAHAPIARALDLPDPPRAADHTELFLFQLYPFASFHVGADGMLGGEAADRVAGFWRALGREVPDEPDHLAALLGLYAGLADAEAREPAGAGRILRRESRKALLWEHLLSWLPPYLHAVSEVASPFYRRWSDLLRAALLSEAAELGAPDRLPLHLREAPLLEDPRTAGGSAFLRQLTAPVRTGILLTRADLARCADDLGLGRRAGERRYVLKALLSSSPEATLDWLGREAARWRGVHGRYRAEAEAVSRFWTSRADAAHRLLVELTRDAREGDRNAPSPPGGEPPARPAAASSR